MKGEKAMNKKLYDLMDWAAIEGITYSEEDNPRAILGPHSIKRKGTLIQAYYPFAKKMEIKIGTKDWQAMEEADDSFFAVLVKDTLPFVYKLRRTMDNGKSYEYYDPYSYPEIINAKDLVKFNNGINYEAYKILGAHITTLFGVEGVHFAVWAPNALRVSVVGDFNMWDGRVFQMQRLGDSGVFEIFIPEVKEGAIYKYEIKLKDGTTFLKADPYGFGAELRPATASVVRNISNHKWNDKKWMSERKQFNSDDAPMFVYEVHLGSFNKPDDGREFYNYTELAPMIADHCKEMGYTHVELMPIMEHPFDASWGYQVIGYYAPTARYGTPKQFQEFVDYLHNEGIGVILDWVPAHFPRDDQGLRCFDGTCLYEHQDPRQGFHPHWGTLIYNYGRPEVSNYLIANALYWTSVYHVDGIRMDAVASMLYLDYGKNDGEWIPNIYGGKENLEAIELLKHLNSIFKKYYPDCMLIAEESTAWPMVTGDLNNDGLGFDLKWNMGWMNDFLGYMSYDPLFRTHHYGELCFSMIYAYSEKFILTLSHDEVVHGKSTLIGKMPGTIEEKFSNLKAAYGHMITHPGKKLLFMGQDIAEFDEWNENRAIQWDLLKYDNHKYVKKYLKDMISLYKTEPALSVLDQSPDGFEWINCISANENIVVYVRKSITEGQDLLVVCNFENIPRNNYKIGVPYSCKLKEIINSDDEKYGGLGFINNRLKSCKADECDGRDYSIRIKVPPLGVSVFKIIPVAEPEKKEAPIKKSTTKNASVKKAAEKKAGSTLVRGKTPKTEGGKVSAASKTIASKPNRLKTPSSISAKSTKTNSKAGKK